MRIRYENDTDELTSQEMTDKTRKLEALIVSAPIRITSGEGDHLRKLRKSNGRAELLHFLEVIVERSGNFRLYEVAGL